MLAECRCTPPLAKHAWVTGSDICVLAFYSQQGRLCTVGAELGHELVCDKLVKGLSRTSETVRAKGERC